MRKLKPPKTKKRWVRTVGLVVPLVILILMCVAGLFARQLAPNDPVAVDLTHQLEQPSRMFPMGTDKLGRCIFSRCLYGIRSSVGFSVLISTIGVALGILIGVVSGYVGGALDTVIMRIVDALMSFPKLILVLVLVGIIGGGTYQIILAMLLVHWVWYARITRSMTISLREHNYVTAAKVSGTSPVRIIGKHILPNIFSQMLALYTMDIGGTIVSLSGFSYLGIGVTPPTPEWGVMINEGREVIRQTMGPLLWPSLMVCVSVLCLNILGENLRARVDEV